MRKGPSICSHESLVQRPHRDLGLYLPTSHHHSGHQQFHPLVSHSGTQVVLWHRGGEAWWESGHHRPPHPCSPPWGFTPQAPRQPGPALENMFWSLTEQIMPGFI